MKAWVIETDANGQRLTWRDVPDLAPGPGELLLSVRAVGLNRADLSRRAGHYERVPTRPPLPIAGLEAAGEVAAVGAGVEGFRVGDRVMGMPSGAYAQQALLHARLAMRVPERLGWVEAAATPVALFTAHDALASAGRMRRGDRVLVQAAASGVGIAALQVARELGAGQVVGTAGGEARLAALARHGLTHGIDYRGEDVGARVLALTGGAGVDVIVDMVGASAVAAHLQAAALGARWVQVGRMGGLVAQLDLDLVSKKRLSLVGVTFRTRDLDEFESVVRTAERDVGPALAGGRFAMPVARTFALDEADRAQEFMRSNAHLGKIVLLA
ncbi:MAG: zinc-binding dehydrogenase [Burkholderiaceae bacterium]